jgi:hypothetical protein
MPRPIFLDTEWTAPPWAPQAQLMWVGLADEDGRAWYGISSEAPIEPQRNAFVAGAFKLIDPHEPRMDRAALAAAVRDFCGDRVDAWWVWVPTRASFAAFFGLEEAEAAALHARWWNVDLQLLQALVQPWPAGWSKEAHDLQAAAAAAGVAIPPRAPDHLHPRVHALWNRELHARIAGADASVNGGARAGLPPA